MAAARPQATTSVLTVVSDGCRWAAISVSSKPVTDSSPGHVDAAGQRQRQPGHRHQVVGVDDRGGRLGEVEQRRGSRAAPDSRGEVGLDAEVASGSPASRSAPRPGRRGGSAPCTIDCGPGDVGDARCARGRRGARRRRRCRGASSTPSAGAGGVGRRAGPTIDGRQAELGEQRGARVVDAQVGEEDAVDAALLRRAGGRSAASSCSATCSSSACPRSESTVSSPAMKDGKNGSAREDLGRPGDHQADGQRPARPTAPGPAGSGVQPSSSATVQDPLPGVRRDARAGRSARRTPHPSTRRPRGRRR